MTEKYPGHYETVKCFELVNHYIRFEPRCLLTDPEYCRICRTHSAVSATAAAQTKKIIKKAKKVVDESVPLQYNTNRSIHWAIAKW